ncbi:MAG: winged helix-turn-helix domain-containing protein [Candidatus Omnitrophica bacterium]|nr:winged helix-turn-helix domain-containing protein [Candidatus Omnitrophota bacterium]
MITWIGLCAGEIWRYLDEHEGKSTLKKVVSGVRAPKETIYMALGWLAREGHIVIAKLEDNSVVQLKKNA